MRSLILGNGSLLVTLDRSGEVRDLYFPRVGLENHIATNQRHRIGVYVDGEMSWLSEDPRWVITIDCEDESLESRIIATNKDLGVALAMNDVVYNEKPIFLRRITVKNLARHGREIKLYLGHEFQIYGSPGGDTGYYDPQAKAIIHYKGQRVFFISGEFDGKREFDYAVGLSNYAEKQGTYVDAADGGLSKNPVEHGPVDSVMGFYHKYKAGEERVIHYWLAAGTSLAHAKELDAYIATKSPQHLLDSTKNFWTAWVNRYDWSFYGLTPDMISLFKKSLMYVRAHVDMGGGIIASADSDTLQHGKDTYAYVWPRDAAYAALALDRAGDTNVAEQFFVFCNQVLGEDGYFMHKYLPDGSLGSSWHPWIKDGKEQLPIQEDETALVIYAFYQHYQHSRDLEFIESMYNSLVEKAANFLVAYRDPFTNLPNASYDLWEEKRGTSTFTSASVYGALNAAGELARILGKTDRESFYKKAAEEVKEGILTYLYDAENEQFAKMIDLETNVRDITIDSSGVYAVFSFGVLPVDDPRLSKAFERMVAALTAEHTGGLGRYERDHYYQTSDESNPWFIPTLWYAEYLIAKAQTEPDLKEVRDIFAWVLKHAETSGILSEQLSTTTGEQLSVAPLTWSHAGYVTAVLAYLDKLESMGICLACNPVP